MNENEKISQTLDDSRPSLSKVQKDLLWENISKKIAKPKPTLSPYLFIFKNKKNMAPIALALVLMLSMSGVVAASESARPGDTLFLVDQTVEDIRLALASDNSKTKLEAQFAAERLLELSSILKESIKKDNPSNTVAATSTSSSTQFEAEARVNEAVLVALNYLFKSNIDEETRNRLFTELGAILEGVSVNVDRDKLKLENGNTRIEIEEDEGDGKIEIRDGENRIKIREKDGEIRIETKNDYLDFESDSDDDLDNTKNSVGTDFNAEADIYPDTTFVEVEINDKKTIYETDADTREEVISEIVIKFNIARSIVEANLDLKIENDLRNISEDVSDNSDMEEDNDKEDRYDDKDEEEDHLKDSENEEDSDD